MRAGTSNLWGCLSRYILIVGAFDLRAHLRAQLMFAIQFRGVNITCAKDIFCRPEFLAVVPPDDYARFRAREVFNGKPSQESKIWA